MTNERIKTSTPASSGLVGLRSRVRLLLLLLVSLSLCLLVSLSTQSPCLGEEPVERPGLPAYRRQFLSPERLPQELKRVGDGVLVRLPLAEFEARVERAKKALGRRPVPRLIEARYRAVLQEDALVGDGQWKVIHAGPAP